MITNKIVNRVDLIWWSFVRFYSTLTMHVIAFLVGIKMGNTVFYGLMKFKRLSSASITIGNNVSFRSLSTSNLIGINRPCIVTALHPGAVVEIGDGCGFSGTVIGGFSRITLGRNVRCGANTLITDSDWHLEDPRVGEPKPIVIEDNVWLGVNVIVMKGVTIGTNTIIGAGSIVTKDIPSNVIAAGNPCKVIKHLHIEDKSS